MAPEGPLLPQPDLAPLARASGTHHASGERSTGPMQADDDVGLGSLPLGRRPGDINELDEVRAMAVGNGGVPDIDGLPGGGDRVVGDVLGPLDVDRQRGVVL